MRRIANRKSALVWVVAFAAAVLLVVIFVIDRPAPETATSQAESIAATLPPGSALPSDEHCAAYAQQVGSDREAVPENTAANMSVPTNLSLPPWPEFWNPSANRLFVPRIDGQFMGTTDQIIVWGACKWGFDTDVIRAMAMQESDWQQAKVADYSRNPALCVGGHPVPCPTSFGLLQLQHYNRPGSWPNSQQHTAFNVDYALGYVRGCFEGWVNYLGNGYAPGDLWGCLGWHYSGQWYEQEARGYIERVGRRLDERDWTRL
jgi:hypothetical protein